MYQWRMEFGMYEHAVKEHTAGMHAAMDWMRPKNENGELFWTIFTYSFYTATVRQRERR